MSLRLTTSDNQESNAKRRRIACDPLSSGDSNLKQATVSPRSTTTNHIETEKMCRIFIDCETSGQGCSLFRQSRIIELAAVTMSSVDGVFRELIAGGPCTAKATEIHNINDSALAEADGFAVVWTRFVEYVWKVQGDATKVCLVGHNSTSTDIYQLLAELERMSAAEGRQREITELLLPGKELVFEDTYPSRLCDRSAFQEELGVDDMKLSTLYKTLCKKSIFEAHNALWDASATRDIWQISPVVQKYTERNRLDFNAQLDKWHKLKKK